MNLIKRYMYNTENAIKKFLLNNPIMIIFFGLLTILSMMINELRFLFIDSRVDKIFYSILIFIIVVRGAEIIIYLISKKNYYLNLFIFDIVSLCFLILNATLFYSNKHSNSNTNEQLFDNFHIFSQVRGYGKDFQLNLISSILQCTRFILVFIDSNFYINIAKCIKKNYSITEINKFDIKNNNKKKLDSKNTWKNEYQTSLSQILSFKFTILIFICVLFYPLFSSSVWIQINTSAFSGIRNLSQLTILRNQYPGDESWPNAYMLELSYFVYTNSIGDSSKWMRLIAIQAPFTLNNNPTCNGCPKSDLEIITNAMSIITNSEFPSWFIEILTLPALKEGISLIPNEDFNKIRTQSLRQYVSQVCMRSGIDAIANFYSSCPEELKARITAVFDISAMTQFGAGLTIGISFSTLLILIILVFLVQGILEKHIFASIKRINNTLISIANNPLLALKMSNNSIKNRIKNDKTAVGNLSNQMLEDTFSKLGTLLAVGLGSAGANIIVQNLKDDKVVVKLPGKKVLGIYGFCDIRNFTDATEILGEDVMLFVNQVAEIAHGVVCKYGGMANKNVGDAFLFVWKPEDKWQTIESFLVDMALLSFIIIIKKIYDCPKLKNISLRSDIQERMPNYRVRLGFGLHYGWAIEGAIGSEFKIDASYLSPNVNLSSRLEEATKHYGVNILFSHNLFDKLSINMKQFCRQIDRVTLKGSKTPISLYTVDIDPELSFNPNTNSDKINYIDYYEMKGEDNHQNRISSRIFSKLLENNGIKDMRKYIFKGFHYKFNKGLKHYLVGNWDIAREILEDLQAECKKNWGKGDGPTETILEFMKKENFKKPINWRGYRIWDKK